MKIRVHDIGETLDAYCSVNYIRQQRDVRKFRLLDSSTASIVTEYSSEIYTNRRLTFHSKLFSKLLVRIDSTLSDSLPVSHEVPQGAIFSPFCKYMNDLPFAS